MSLPFETTVDDITVLADVQVTQLVHPLRVNMSEKGGPSDITEQGIRRSHVQDLDPTECRS
jgi:hypothetical protein